MKKQIIFLALFFPLIIFSQIDGRFGVTVGATNLIIDTNFLSSKSSLGYTFGVIGTNEFNDRMELFVEANYIKHFSYFLGRETPESTPEYIKYNLENVNVSFILDYAYIVKDDFKFGVNVGPTASFLHSFKIVDLSKEDYLLDPLTIESYDLMFDERNNRLSFNAFISLGLSFQYREIMCNLRYFKGITDPYRDLPVFSPFLELKGKEDFMSLTFSYFFDY